MPSLFFPAQTVDSQHQGLLEEIRSGHGHVQRLGDPRYSGTVRWGLPPGGRRRRLGLGAAPHRMPLPAVQVLWEPLLCGGLHPGETGISESDRPRHRTHRLPLVGTLRDIFRKQVNRATNRPLPGNPRQRLFALRSSPNRVPACFSLCGPVCRISLLIGETTPSRPQKPSLAPVGRVWKSPISQPRRKRGKQAGERVGAGFRRLPLTTAPGRAGRKAIFQRC